MQTPLNLVIDVGNSFIKMAVFKKDLILEKKSCPQEALLPELEKILSKYPDIKYGILAAVAKVESAILRKIVSKIELLRLDHATKVPFYNLYNTPKTLGIDRIALVAAASFKYATSNTLVIDAGTCITYDFKNSNNEYLGGSIAPGIKMRYKSMHQFTANLPLLQQQNIQEIVGKSTDEAMHAGVVFGVQHEMDGIISHYCHMYPNLIVILSGGDAEFLSKRLKNTIFANSDFLLEGLNHLLVFNNSQ